MFFPIYPFEEKRHAVYIVDAWTKPKQTGNPFGPLTAGSIRLVGTLVKLVYLRAPEFENQGWLGGARCKVSPDEGFFDDNELLCCLPLELRAESVIGLIVELTGSTRGEYVRKGHFAVVNNNASEDVLEYNELFMAACKSKADMSEANYEEVEDDTDKGFPRYCISLV